MGSAKNARASVSAALDAANDAFHDAYDDAEARKRDDAPVLVLLGDVLYVRGNAKTTENVVVPAEAHAIKSAVHVPVAVWTVLRQLARSSGGKLVATLASLDEHAAACAHDVERDESLRDLLADTRAFLAGCRRDERIDADALDAFARHVGERMGPLMERAAELELDLLHAAVEKALERLDADDIDGLHVVVAGVHQARDRSLGMQYFAERFRDRPGAEHRVLYAENAATLDEALAVVGKHRIDREMARAFFGDPARMQRDLLGDAAERILARRDVGSIDREH